MTGRALNGDEHTVDCDHPKDIWKKHGAQSVDHGPSGRLMLKAVLEEPQIGPHSSGTVCCGVQTRAVLAREKVIHVFAAYNMVRMLDLRLSLKKLPSSSFDLSQRVSGINATRASQAKTAKPEVRKYKYRQPISATITGDAIPKLTIIRPYRVLVLTTTTRNGKVLD